VQLPTKELFQIIPMHMMNMEIIPGSKKLWLLLAPWAAAVELLATLCEQKQINLSGRW